MNFISTAGASPLANHVCAPQGTVPKFLDFALVIGADGRGRGRSCSLVNCLRNSCAHATFTDLFPFRTFFEADSQHVRGGHRFRQPELLRGHCASGRHRDGQQRLQRKGNPVSGTTRLCANAVGDSHWVSNTELLSQRAQHGARTLNRTFLLARARAPEAS